MTWEELLKAANGEKTKKHLVHREDNLQMQCVTWMQLQYPQWAQLLHHSPNGGARSKVEGAIFKKMGTRAGFPDLFLYVPTAEAHGLAIEMKTTEKGSRQSDNQKHWQRILTEQGYQYTVCRTVEEFQQTIKQYLKL